MAPRSERTAKGPAEDGVVFIALVATLFYIVFMLSLPLWLSTVIRSLTG